MVRIHVGSRLAAPGAVHALAMLSLPSTAFARTGRPVSERRPMGDRAEVAPQNIALRAPHGGAGWCRLEMRMRARFKTDSHPAMVGEPLHARASDQ